MKKVADQYASSAAAQWAEVGYADLNLAHGANQLFKDRPEANAKLLAAEEAYQKVLDKARDPELIARAQFGMQRPFVSLAFFLAHLIVVRGVTSAEVAHS